MQTVVRGESRPRRIPSTDSAPTFTRQSRSRRSLSSHRIDFNSSTTDPYPTTNTITPSSSPSHAFHPAIKSLAYFCVAPLLYGHHITSIIFISIPAFFFAFFCLTLFTRSFLSTARFFRSHKLPFASIFLLSTLYIYYLLSTFLAIKLIGPIRALLAVFTQPILTHCFISLLSSTASPRRVSLFCTILTVIALSFLAYDATGGHAPGRRAAKVRDRVMQSAAGQAVHAKLQKFSYHVQQRYLQDSAISRTFTRFHWPQQPNIEDNAVEKPMNDDGSDEDDKIDVNIASVDHDNNNNTDVNHEHQNESEKDVAKLKEDPPPPLIMDAQQPNLDQNNESENVRDENDAPETQQKQHNENNDDLTLNKRRLLSIVKGKDVLAFENSTHQQTDKFDKVETDVNDDENRQPIEQKSESNDIANPSETSTRILLTNAILGILLAMSASIARRIAVGVQLKTNSENTDMVIPSSLIFLFCSIIMLPLFGLTCLSIYIYAFEEVSEITTIFIACCCGIGFLFLVVPSISEDNHRRHISTQFNNSTALKNTNRNRQVGNAWRTLSIDTEYEAFRVFQSFIYFLLVAQLTSIIGLRSDESEEKITFSCFLTATILASVSLMLTPTQSKHGKNNSGIAWSRPRGTDNTDFSTELRGNFLVNFKGLVLDVRKATNIAYMTLLDLTSHARSNKASWQVLNFLVLQFSMAIIELIYATAANSASLFSVSADNFFCGVALSIGLFSIRASSGKPSQTFPYGLARVESISGFANGIILIYVAVLVVLEAYERAYDNEDIATGQAFSVCILGTIGNVLGLLFFPPESRRENHNVQGIYLHIWANTLAFASMAMTTAITAAQPEWNSIDIIVSIIAAMCVVGMAIPLLVRSARLLLLLQPRSTALIVKSAREQLLQINGVASVSALRVWNLTPNSLVGSVRLSVSEESGTSDTEVLLRARSVFASIGIPASQCTIHVLQGA